MNTSDKAVEALLEHASPRPTPPSEDEHVIRAVVQAEWQAISGKRRARIRLARFAIAATVLLAMIASFNVLRNSGIEPVQVATINKSYGSIYMLGEQSELHKLSDLSSVTVGQKIVTGKESGISLEWGNGGSLRIDAETRVEFISAEAIYLRSGRIYFDSSPSNLIMSVSGGSNLTKFRIETDYGAVTHLGTQYMAETSSEALVITVREGRVSIDGNYHDETALEGQRMEIVGSKRAAVVNYPRHGSAWNWVEQTAPIADVDGRSVDEFLNWVSRETGLRIVYASPEAEQKASSGILRGKVDMDPRSALAFRMMGEDLNWHIDGGTIKVSSIDENNGR